MVKQILTALVAGGLALSAVAMDLTEEQREEIARRLEPVGDVCLQGDSSCVVRVSSPANSSASSGGGSGSGGSSGSGGGSSSGGSAASGGAQVADASSTVDGEAVYNQACVACHSTGAGGAPMVGDIDQWAPRISKGMEALHQSGLKGVTGTSMMAKGGRADLSDEQVVAAVNYMVENSQ